MVDAPGPPAPVPPGGSPSTFLSVDGGRSQTFSSSTSRGPSSTVSHRRLQLRWWPLSDLPSAPLRGPTVDVFNFSGGRCRTCRQHSLGGPLSTSLTSVVAATDLPSAPPRGPPSTFLALMVGAPGAIDVFNFGGGRCRTCRQPARPRGPTVDVFNFSGGRCQTCRQHPPGGPPSTSSTSVVAAAGPAASTPRGPPSMSSTSVVVAVGPAASSP
jgi:hypothetical protein